MTALDIMIVCAVIAGLFVSARKIRADGKKCSGSCSGCSGCSKK